MLTNHMITAAQKPSHMTRFSCTGHTGAAPCFPALRLTWVVAQIDIGPDNYSSSDHSAQKKEGGGGGGSPPDEGDTKRVFFGVFFF